MGPERKFYEEVKKSIPSISWIRLENNSLHGKTIAYLVLPIYWAIIILASFSQ